MRATPNCKLIWIVYWIWFQWYSCTLREFPKSWNSMISAVIYMYRGLRPREKGEFSPGRACQRCNICEKYILNIIITTPTIHFKHNQRSWMKHLELAEYCLALWRSQSYFIRDHHMPSIACGVPSNTYFAKADKERPVTLIGNKWW